MLPSLTDFRCGTREIILLEYVVYYELVYVYPRVLVLVVEVLHVVVLSLVRNGGIVMGRRVTERTMGHRWVLSSSTRGGGGKEVIEAEMVQNFGIFCFRRGDFFTKKGNF